jgi:SAM-dependent methyltransferase
MTYAYHAVRLTPDVKRDVLWRTLWKTYFRKHVAADFCVLDLGSGYGSFINNVVAERRIALDAWPGLRDFADPGVEVIIGDVADLEFLADGAVDFAFASNLFEHLPQTALARVLATLRVKLSARGTLTIVQPNYRFAFREYFDDYTHITVYSHISMADFLQANGYEVIDVVPRFMPLTVKSRVPVTGWLIAAYLMSPFKPFGKQMLLTARPMR